MKPCILWVVLSLCCNLSAKSQQFTSSVLQVTFEGRYTDGRYGACEIADIEPINNFVVVTNAASDSVDIIDWTNLAMPVKVASVPVWPYGGGANSVAVIDTNYFAVAIEDTIKQDSGRVVFFDFSGSYVSQVRVGALPDMIKLTPNKQQLLVACEGEPNDAYTVDPEGMIGIIDLTGGVASLTQAQVTLLGFQGATAPITGALLKPNASIAQDLEPEHIAVNAASTQAAVVCQENNMLIFVDLVNQAIVSYKGLGFKDHAMVGNTNAFDASNRDNAINLQPHPVKGVYQPDGIVGFESLFDGNSYYATANEGDARDYSGYSSEVRIKDLVLDTMAFPNASALQQDAELGRLKTFTADMIGDMDGDGDVDELYSYGGRSVSIWDDSGTLIWDSGQTIELYMATNFPKYFNCDDGLASEKDSRSDDKGPEPEAIGFVQFPVLLGSGSNAFLAVGLERQGGIMFFDVTTPTAPVLALFVHSYDTAAGTMVDIAPEGIVFADHQPSGEKIMLVSHEGSGTIAAYSIRPTNVSSSRTLPMEVPFRLAPNPVREQLNLILTTAPSDALHYKVYNHLGQIVQIGACRQKVTTLSTIDWNAGIYWVYLQDTTGNAYPAQQVVKY